VKVKHIIVLDVTTAHEGIVAKNRQYLDGNKTDLKKVQHVIGVGSMLLAEHKY
jgi:hypothetical protein